MTLFTLYQEYGKQNVFSLKDFILYHSFTVYKSQIFIILKYENPRLPWLYNQYFFV